MIPRDHFIRAQEPAAEETEAKQISKKELQMYDAGLRKKDLIFIKP